MCLTDTAIFYLSVLLLNIFKQSNAERVKCNPYIEKEDNCYFTSMKHFPPYISTSISDSVCSNNSIVLLSVTLPWKMREKSTQSNMSKINTWIIGVFSSNTFWMSLRNLNQLYIKYGLFLVL